MSAEARPLWKELREHPSALFLAGGLHIAAALLFGLSLHFSQPDIPANVPAEIVEATAVSGEEFDKEREGRLAAERAAAEAKHREEQRRQAEVQRQKEVEAKRQAEAEAKRQAELKAQREAEAKRKAEAERQQREQAERERLARLKQEEEKRRQAEVEAEKALMAKRLQEEEARLEAERKAEAERRAALEAQRKAEEDARRQAARRAQLNSLAQQYQAAIRAKVQNAWLRPSGERAGQTAEVLVTQTPGGFIQAVRILKCSGTEVFCRSVEQAVWRAEPLPAPPDPDVFDREIRFTFAPDQ